MSVFAIQEQHDSRSVFPNWGVYLEQKNRMKIAQGFLINKEHFVKCVIDIKGQVQG